MKKAIKRFWGVGLIIIILSSLFVMPASVSADDNEWMSYSGPSGATYTYKSGAQMFGYAVQGNGAVTYAVIGDNQTYKSTNGGVSWAQTNNSTPIAMTPTMIAVAPDNADRIAISDGTNVFASVNGGISFSNLGSVAVTGYTLSTIECLTISPTRLGASYVTVSGSDNSSNGVVFYYNLGAVVGQGWARLVPAGDYDFCPAVAYSPNFGSDLTMEAVTANTSGTIVKLQVYSFSGSGAWNSADYVNYPVTVVTGTGTLSSVTKASMALDPAFLGGEDSLRNTFIGLYTSDSSASGIFRVLNTTSRNLASGNIYSVAYDGTTLVAGQADSTSVLRSLDPMASVPTVTGSSSLKSPGGISASGVNTIVSFAGANVVAGTRGTNSAFAISRSSGAYFNDVSFINTAVTYAWDLAVSPDSKKIYYLTSNSATSGYASLWLKTTGWERVLTYPITTNNYTINLSPANADVVYVAERGGTRVYFSKDVQTRWYARTCTDGGGTFNISSLAVESDAVAYAINSSGYVIKSTNEGFIWSITPVSSKLTSAYTLASVKENVLLVGSAAGKVAYSLDGGTTFTSILPATEAGAGAVIVIPDENYATNNIIYAATTTAGCNVMKWVVGTSTVWEDAYKDTSTSMAYGIYGLAMKGGILYALGYLPSTQTSGLYQYVPAAKTWTFKVSGLYTNPVTGALEMVQLGIGAPNAMEASTGSNKLWALRYNPATGGSPVIFILTDTMATAVPAISGPADKVSVTSSSGTADVVILTWARVTNATSHTYQVAYDNAFTQTLNGIGTAVAFPTLNAIIGSATSAVPLAPGHTYYWRVRADTPLSSSWSEVRSITVQALAAAVPGIASPTNGATILSQSPAFSWSPVTGTTKYEFQLSTTPTFGTTVLTDTPASAGTLVPVTIKLEQGKQYFWRVRALEPVQGDWSTAANFIVAVPATTAAPVVVTQVPAPTFTIPAAQPAPTYTLVPPAEEVIAPTYIWAIIIIGAILVIAVIVLIVRTRRSV
jgi:hypothetical protein